MYDAEIIQSTQHFVKERFLNESSGHDWWHIFRVWKLAKKIAQKEGADLYITELAALLHDMDDWKFQGKQSASSPVKTRKFLENRCVDANVIDSVCHIIINVSFKGAGTQDEMDSIEGMVVQDADRLDAIGAIGIARAFTFGGHYKQPIFDPSLKPIMHKNFAEYKSKDTTTINHFHEKLLLLKDRMHTKMAKKIAQDRYEFMLLFLTQFMDEWNLG